MKTKILLSCMLFICLNSKTQNIQSQQQFIKQFSNENHFPGMDVWYDSVKRVLVHPGKYLPANTGNSNTGKTASDAFHLTKDINTATDANPTNFNFSAYQTQQYAVLNNVIYYSADDGVHGSELWKSDGTATGTKMVKDIYPGETGSSVSNITVAHDKLYFFATSPDYGSEIWVSDGTAAGTKILKDMVPGTGSYYSLCMCNVNGTLFFLNNYGQDNQLWKSDGTTAGTAMVTDLTTSLGCTQAFQLVAVNNLLFFTGENTSFSNRELYRSDGTAAGTYMVKDINPNPYDNGPSHLTAYKNKLYFSAGDGTNQYLWVSDGTPAGTTYVPGYNNVTINTVNTVYPLPFIIAGGSMYFPAYNSTYGNELFKYNADNGLGVVLVKDINAVSNSTYFTTDVMAAIGSTVYFAFADINGLSQLWKTTGTDAGTKKVANLPQATAYHGFYSGNGKIYFDAYTAATGYELWRSDGTAANTGILKNIFAETSSNPSYYTACNNKVFFAAQNASGFELWQTDGTTANTTLVKDANTTTTGSSNPDELTAFNNKIVFSASTLDKGNELYMSDGTAPGTHLIKDLIPGQTGSGPQQFKIKNNYAYFAADDVTSNVGIFKTDGTTAGTTELSNWSFYSYYFYGDYAIADNNLVFYILYKAGTSIQELWRTDGTVSGTYLLKTNLYYSAKTLTAMGNNVFFAANDLSAAYGTELWKSNGTVAGTKMLKDIVPASDGSNPQSFYAFNGILYFSAYDETENALWKSNGTAAGTIKLASVYPFNFQASGSLVYFRGYTSAFGSELWKTNGSTTGTKQVMDIAEGNADANLSNLTDVNGTLFFTADDGVHGNELWKSKGSAANTKMVKDITTGGSSSLDGFTAAASKLFFMYYDVSLSKYALWVSDGTNAGTNAIADNGLDDLSYINGIEGSGNKLFLSGANYLYGGELFEGDVSVLNKDSSGIAVKLMPSKINISLGPMVYPNPVNNNAVIIFNTTKAGKYSLQLTDVSGKVLKKINGKAIAGENKIMLNVSNYAQGMYIIDVTDDEFGKQTLKLNKQ